MDLIWTLVGLATVGVPAYLAARGFFRLPPGLDAVLGAALLGWAWLSLGVLVLGNLGWLGRGPLLGWNGLAWLAILPAARNRAPGGAPSVGERWGADAILAVGLAAWAAVALGAPSLLYPVKVVSDGPIYHLPFAVKWWQAGRLYLIPTPFGESAAPYFPAVGDLWLTWLVVLEAGDRLARVGQVPFLLLAAATAYASARRLGARPGPAAIGATLLATVTPFLFFSFEPNVDTIFVAGYVLAVHFAARSFLGDGGLRSLGLAGLAAGAAWGTKAPGVVFVPPLIALMGLAALLGKRDRADKAKAVAILATTPMILEGYWLVRNAALTGNPLYPLHLRIFGRTILQGWFGPEAMPTSPYYLAPGDWRSLVDTLLNVFDPRLLPLWLAAVAVAGLSRGEATPERRAARCWAGLAVLNLALFWLLIPYRTQDRFMFQAAALAAVPLALLLDRSAWLRWAAVALLAVHVLTPNGWPAAPAGQEPPWDLSAKVFNAFPPPITVDPGGRWLLVGAGAIATVGWFARARRRGVFLRLAPAVGLAAVVALEAWIVTPTKDAAIRLRFPIYPNYLRGWIDLDGRTAQGGARIAYAGHNLPYYLMGQDFRNDVFYINVDAHPGWLLHDYHRAAPALGLPSTWPDTRPGWDRVRPDYVAWLANLRAARIELLVVTRADPAEGRHNQADAAGFPIERVWADAHPENFSLLYSDPLFRTYRLRPGP